MIESEVREVFRKIAAGERRHGYFLTTFAKAVMCADDLNFATLLPAANHFIAKYGLSGYSKSEPL